MEDKILESLRRGISQLPALPFEKIAQPMVTQQAEHDHITQQNMPKGKIIPLFMKVLPLVAILAITAFVFVNQYFLVDSIVQMDVNPSFEITVNKQNKVLDITGLNPDGFAFLEQKNYRKQTIDDAIEHLFTDLKQANYFENDQNDILLSVKNKKRDRNQELLALLSDDVALAVSKYNLHPNIYTQELYQDKNLEDIARNYGISQGKLQVIQTLLEQDSSLVRDDLATLAFHELKALAAERGLQLYLAQTPYPSLRINIASEESEESSKTEKEGDLSHDESSADPSEESPVEVSSSDDSVAPVTSSEVSVPPVESKVPEVSSKESSVAPLPVESSKLPVESSTPQSSTPDAITDATTDATTEATTDAITKATD